MQISCNNPKCKKLFKPKNGNESYCRLCKCAYDLGYNAGYVLWKRKMKQEKKRDELEFW